MQFEISDRNIHASLATSVKSQVFLHFKLNFRGFVKGMRRECGCISCKWQDFSWIIASCVSNLERKSFLSLKQEIFQIG